MTAKVKVKVCDGWAVYDGVAQRHGGQQLDVDRDTAERWETAGWVERVEGAKAKAAARRK